MAEPRTFTAIVLRHMLADPDMPETVRQWVLAEPDHEERAVQFACQLSEDLMDAATTDSGEAALFLSLVRAALERVVFRRVADELLRRFTLPAFLAVPDERSRPRWSAAVGAAETN